jgi:hypothetical protein
MGPDRFRDLGAFPWVVLTSAAVVVDVAIRITGTVFVERSGDEDRSAAHSRLCSATLTPAEVSAAWRGVLSVRGAGDAGPVGPVPGASRPQT